MDRAVVASLGNRTGWAIGLGSILVIAAVYSLTRLSGGHARSPVRVDPAIAQVIRVEAPIEPIVGGLSEEGDAAAEYNRALLDALATANYKDLLARIRERDDPDAIDTPMPDYLLAAARKKDDGFIERFTRRNDWMVLQQPWYVGAFHAIRTVAAIKADRLIRAGRTQEGEDLLKALLIFGHRLEQQRVRREALQAALSMQMTAARLLERLYTQTDRPELARATSEYLDALAAAQGRVIDKAGLTVARLHDGSPPTADLLWLVENDQDRMWRIEAILILGLAQWTAPLAGDRQAAKEKLESLVAHDDPWIAEAARAALAMTPEDVRKVR